MRNLILILLFLMNVTNVHAAALINSARIGNYSYLAPLYVGQVSTGNKLPDFSSSAASNRQFRTYHVAKDNINNNLQIAYANWYLASPDTDTSPGGTITVSAAIEYPIGVTSTPVTWSTAGTVVIANGSTSALSDPISVVIPSGAAYMVRTYEQPTGGFIVLTGESTSGGQIDSLNGEGSIIGGANQNSSVGVITGTAETSYIYGPILQVAPTRKPAIMIVGDSRQIGVTGSGVHDAYSDATGDIGQLARSVGVNFAYANVGKSGGDMESFESAHSKRIALAPYFTHAIMGYGINDAGSRSAATIFADSKTIAGYFTGLGMKFFACTEPPKTTSTDSWKTLSGQTQSNPTTTTIIAYNNLVRTSPANYTGYFELANITSSGVDSGYWATNGSTSYYTPDGLHESTGGNNAYKNANIINTKTIVR